jgi:hypothetical protein
MADSSGASQIGVPRPTTSLLQQLRKHTLIQHSTIKQECQCDIGHAKRSATVYPTYPHAIVIIRTGMQFHHLHLQRVDGQTFQTLHLTRLKERKSSKTDQDKYTHAINKSIILACIPTRKIPILVRLASSVCISSIVVSTEHPAHMSIQTIPPEQKRECRRIPIPRRTGKSKPWKKRLVEEKNATKKNQETL